MKTTFTMNTTSERDHLLSHLCVHISPDFYLLLPFYALYSKAVTLQVMQAVVIALGIVPLLGICKNHGLTRMESALTVIAYCLYPVMSGGCFTISMRICSCRCLYCRFVFSGKGKFKGQYHQSDLTAGGKKKMRRCMRCVFLFTCCLSRKRQAGSATVSCLRQVCCILFYNGAFVGHRGRCHDIPL